MFMVHTELLDGVSTPLQAGSTWLGTDFIVGLQLLPYALLLPGLRLVKDLHPSPQGNQVPVCLLSIALLWLSFI